MYNALNNSLVYMCSFEDSEYKSLKILEPGKERTWKFTQISFPLHWCYIYVNSQISGFFWAYGVRSRCTDCFWKIDQYPYLYRDDRSRWEIQYLYDVPNLKMADDMDVPDGDDGQQSEGNTPQD